MQLVQSTTATVSGTYIAHEVNQPLTAILANAETALEWLASDPPNLEAARRAVERVIGNGHRAGLIVRSLLDLSRKSPAQTDDVDLGSVIEHILDLTSFALCRHDIAVKVELCPYLQSVRGNRCQLEQVFANLVTNAVDAMSAVLGRRRELRIRTKPVEECHAQVTVEDSGIGIEPANMDRVFQPLFTTKRDGTGLGLPISRSIVEAHGGRMWVRPNSPCGSVFSFVLPLR